jgi:hypothetical protein
MNLFSRILFETAPKYTTQDDTSAVEMLRTHCSDALWMLTSNTPIYRGDKQLTSEAGFLYVDPSETVRKSKNTTNFYTSVFDAIPSWADWPKRSRSFIGSSDPRTAGAFGGGGRPWILIPFNGVQIGVCSGSDLWDTPVRLSTRNYMIDDLNSVFAGVNCEEYSDLDKLSDSDLSLLNKRLRTQFQTISDVKWWVGDAYSPQSLQLEKYTTSTLPKTLMARGSREVWVSGKCVMISPSMWDRLRAAL